MPNSTPKMQSWQIFHYARKFLKASTLYAIFGKKNARAVDYWCEDPDYTARPEGSYDPILGVKKLLQRLDDQGHCQTVRATIAYLSEGTSCAIKPAAIVEPLPSITEEILADFRAVSALQNAIEGGFSITAIQYAKGEAMAEIERTVARYMKDGGAA